MAIISQGLNIKSAPFLSPETQLLLHPYDIPLQYIGIGGSTFAVDSTIVILGIFVLLLIFYLILFAVLRKLQQIKKKRTATKDALIAKPYATTEETPAEIPVKAEPLWEKETLDGRYAREYNLLQCLYCETFNSQGALRCCACGKHIRR